jgi:phosphatidylglycerol:prolipoprotein diacylglycerol transferase
MHPVLIKIFGLEIHTYGVFIAAAFMVCTYIAIFMGKNEGIEQEILFDFIFYILIFSIIGARVFYVVINYSYYLKHPLAVLKIWEGGLVYYGGLIFGVFSVIFYKKKYPEIKLLHIGDILLTVLPLGQAIGRLGWLSAGCCYGRPCHLPWAIKFSDPQSLAPVNILLHPTEIYHAIVNFLIFLYLFFIVRKNKKFLGQSVVFYGILYSTGRFFIEFFRGDPRGHLWIFSTSQIISIFIFFTSIIAFFILKKNSKEI